MLEEKTKLKMCVIGIGNAGNQIALAAHNNGHSAFAINTSVKDLGDDVLNSSLYSYIVGDGGRGSGKRRETAKQFILDSRSGKNAEIKKLLAAEQFIQIINPCDIVVVTASTGGGTGSGLAPIIVSVISQKWANKTVIFYGILPKHSESPIAHLNTMACVNEIASMNIPYMLADLSTYEDDVYDVAYDKIRKHILTSLNIIRGDYLTASKHGMMDELDELTIISEPGYMSIVFVDNISQSSVEKQSIQSSVINAIKNSAGASIQRDGIVKQMGVITNLPEELDDPIKTGNYSELEEYIGTPLATFENYSVTDKPNGNIALIISGMSLPYNSLSESIKIINEYEQKNKDAKSYNNDLSEDIGKHAGLTKKSNLNKILQIEDNHDKPDDIEIDIPDFLK